MSRWAREFWALALVATAFGCASGNAVSVEPTFALRKTGTSETQRQADLETAYYRALVNGEPIYILDIGPGGGGRKVMPSTRDVADELKRLGYEEISPSQAAPEEILDNRVMRKLSVPNKERRDR